MADFIIGFLVTVFAGLVTHFLIKYLEDKKKN